MKRFSPCHCLVAVVLANALLVCDPPTHAQDTRDGARAFKVEYGLFEPISRTAGDHHAGLFVGVNEFDDVARVRPLLYAVHDAVELAYLFVVELKLIPPENCRLALAGKPRAASVVKHLRELEKLGVTVTDAEKNTILKAISDVQAIATRKSDFLVASFSSHGFAEPPIPYIMPSDGLRRFLDSTALRLPTIEAEMGRSDAGHRLLLVDACQERVDASSARPTTGPVGLPMSDTWQTELKKPTGQAKLASCSKDQYSYESSELGGVGHGVFTYALLDALRGGASADDKNLIRLGSVASYVSRRVEAWTVKENRNLLPNEKPKHQSPSFHGPETTRQLPLAVRADDVAMLTAALENRVEPSGPFTPELHDRLVKVLRRTNTSDQSARPFLSTTYQFSQGRLASAVYVPYLREELAKREELREEFTNSVGMPFRLIPAGEFWMGSSLSAEEVHEKYPGGKVEYYEDEHPRHKVRITRPFYLGVHEVTVGDFKRFVSQTSYRTTAEREGTAWGLTKEGKWEEVKGLSWRNPGFTQTDDHPVTCVSWDDTKAYIDWLSGLEGRRYRLPREAEWEYACRADTSTVFFWGNDADDGEGYLNGAGLEGSPIGTSWSVHFDFDDGFPATSPVGQYKPNAWGLYDMHGNVWEWCSDWYDEDYYGESPTVDPTGPSSGASDRVDRGGGWDNHAGDCRAANRNGDSPGLRYSDLGFRLALVPSE